MEGQAQNIKELQDTPDTCGRGDDENKRCLQTCHSEQTQESTDYRRCHRLSGKEKNTSGSDQK